MTHTDARAQETEQAEKLTAAAAYDMACITRNLLLLQFRSRHASPANAVIHSSVCSTAAAAATGLSSAVAACSCICKRLP